MGSKSSKLSATGGLLDPVAPPGYVGGDGSITVLEIAGITGLATTPVDVAHVQADSNRFDIRRSASKIAAKDSQRGPVRFEKPDHDAPDTRRVVKRKPTGFVKDENRQNSIDFESSSSAGLEPIKSSMRVTKHPPLDSSTKRVRISDSWELIGESDEQGN